jgi:hypothetical protein
MKPIDQTISDRVMSNKKELMQACPASLRQLPLYTPEEFVACGKPQELGVWHDKTDKGEDIVVVQCKRQILWGYGHMFAEGFVLDATDKVRDAEEKLMWDYR